MKSALTTIAILAACMVSPVTKATIPDAPWKSVIPSPDAPHVMQAGAIAAATASNVVRPTVPAADELIFKNLVDSLEHDPAAVFAYVRDHLDFIAYFGYVKGPLKTYLDRGGNDIDTAMLLAKLLSYCSGHAIGSLAIKSGTMSIPLDKAGAWMRMDGLLVESSLSQLMIDISYDASGVKVKRYWLTATIDGVTYDLDPAMKYYQWVEPTEGNQLWYNVLHGNTGIFDGSLGPGGIQPPPRVSLIDAANPVVAADSYTLNSLDVVALNAAFARIVEKAVPLMRYSASATALFGDWKMLPPPSYTDQQQLPTALPYPISGTVTVGPADDSLQAQLSPTMTLKLDSVDESLVLYTPSIAGRQLSLNHINGVYVNNEARDATAETSLDIPLAGGGKLQLYVQGFNFGTLSPGGFSTSVGPTGSCKIKSAPGSPQVTIDRATSSNSSFSTWLPASPQQITGGGTGNISVDFNPPQNLALSQKYPRWGWYEPGPYSASITVYFHVGTQPASSMAITIPIRGAIFGPPQSVLMIDNSTLYSFNEKELSSYNYNRTANDLTLTMEPPAALSGYHDSLTLAHTYHALRTGAYAIVSDFAGGSQGPQLEAAEKVLSKLWDTPATTPQQQQAASEKIRLGTLHAMGADWLQQTNMAGSLLDRRTGHRVCPYYRVGLVAQEWDMTGRSQGFYIDVANVWVTELRSRISTMGTSAIEPYIMFASALEHGIIEQKQPGKTAASTARMVRQALLAGARIALLNKNTFATARAGFSNYSAADLDGYASALASSSSASVLMPSNGGITCSPTAAWKGYGAMLRTQGTSGNAWGMLIQGGYHGGYAGEPYSEVVPNDFYDDDVASAQQPVQQSFQKKSGEPVNLTTGSYLYDHTDFDVGAQAPPNGISFARHYDSGRASVDSPLGCGWSHNWDSSVQHLSSPKLTWGQRGQVDALPALLAIDVMMSLTGGNALTNAQVPEVVREVMGLLAANWCVDTINNNATSVSFGQNEMTFSDFNNGGGPFNSPPGVTVKLTKTAANTETYTLQDLDGSQTRFAPVPVSPPPVGALNPVAATPTAPKLTAIVDPFGHTLNLTYDDYGMLKSITDSQNRAMTFLYNKINTYNRGATTGKSILVQVKSTNGGQTRLIQFTQTGGNLTAFTDSEKQGISYQYFPGSHLMSKIINGLGKVVVANQYNSDGVTVSQDAYGDSAHNHWKFFCSEWRTVQEDPQGGRQTLYFDRDQRTLADFDEAHHGTFYNYNDANQITAVTDPAELRTETSYDWLRGMLPSQVTYPDGTSSTQDYDNLGRPTVAISRGGKKVENVYYLANKTFLPDEVKVYESSTDIRNTKYTYADGLVSTQTDPANRSTSFQYWPSRQVKSVSRQVEVLPTGGSNTSQTVTATTAYTYTPWGDLETSTDEGGTVTKYAYNTRHQVTSSATLDASSKALYTVTTTYDAAGDAVITQDSEGFKLGTSWSAQGKELATYVISTAGVFDASRSDSTFRTKNTYDSRDWLIATTYHTPTNTLANTKFQYYANGWLQTTTNALNQPTTTAYSANRMKTAVTDPGGWRAVVASDPVARTKKVSDAFQPDPNGTDPFDASSAASVLYTLKPDGEIASLTDRRTHQYTFDYTGLGQVKTLRTPENRSASYTYDSTGSRKTSQWSGGNAPSLAGYYPLSGRLKTVQDGLGTQACYYDSNGNLRQVYAQAGSLQSDNRKRSIDITYDYASRPQVYEDQNGYATQFTYYPNGQVKTVGYPSKTGAFSNVTYNYYPDRSLKSVVDWKGRTTSFRYYPDGHLKSITRPNKTRRTLTYTVIGQLESVLEQSLAAATAKTLYYCKYRYDQRGRLQERQTYAAPSSAPPSRPAMNATYDADNRIVTVNNVSVTSDNEGNLVSGPLPNGTTLTGSYGFDARNRLTSVNEGAGVSTSYKYDMGNNRTSVVRNGQTVVFGVAPLGGLSQVMSERSLVPATGTVPPGTMQIAQRLYVYAPSGILLYHVDMDYQNIETLAQLNPVPALPSVDVPQYYLYDAIGSTVALTSSTATVSASFAYSPYGEVTSRTGSVSTRFLFCGSLGVQTDANGLLYMRARYYNPFTARFISQDPIGFDAGTNWFAYAGGNPLTNIDPSGLDAIFAYGSNPGNTGFFKAHAEAQAAQFNQQHRVYDSVVIPGPEGLGAVVSLYKQTETAYVYSANDTIEFNVALNSVSNITNVTWIGHAWGLSQSHIDVSQLDGNNLSPGATMTLYGCHTGVDDNNSGTFSAQRYADHFQIPVEGMAKGVSFGFPVGWNKSDVYVDLAPGMVRDVGAWTGPPTTITAQPRPRSGAQANPKPN